ncbi:MAG: hypothetical protein HRT35_07440 [Algicola sp.]|nr:hypothetical protein [Algicola sp.]
MKRICLWDVIGVVMIVKSPSGVLYGNQTGGCACFQDEQEGILLPFNNDESLDKPELDLSFKLSRLLENVFALTDNDADNIDEILNSHFETRCATVDRSKLSSSKEAWIHVIVKESEESCMVGFGDCEGVLTWPNSD